MVNKDVIYVGIDAPQVIVKPCPCCGNKKLYVGCLGMFRFGVRCMHITPSGRIKGCRLELALTTPDKYPKNCKTLENLENLTLNKAIKAWNKRI